MTITSTPVGKNPIEWSSPYSQQNSLRHTTWVQSQNDRMILVHFQGKLFNTTVSKSMPTDAKEAERFYEDLQDLLELTPKKKSFSS